jgi:hypothetical protein
MISLNEPCDPKVHATAVAIAKRCLYIIQAVLREEEWGDALREFYMVARDEIQNAQQHERG